MKLIGLVFRYDKFCRIGSNKNYFGNDGRDVGLAGPVGGGHHGKRRVPDILLEPGYFARALILFRHLQAGFPRIKYQNYQNRRRSSP